MNESEALRRQQPHYHNSDQVIKDDVHHLIVELYKWCKTHNVPLLLMMEHGFQQEGSFFQNTGYFPDQRAADCGWPARMILANFIAAAPNDLILEALKVLKRKGLIEVQNTPNQ